MLALMQAHYVNVSESEFHADLEQKNWVILLESENLLYGFSTQAAMVVPHEGQLHRVVFSGDTIIAREAWGGLELPIAWGVMMRALRDSHPSPLHWFLISKGYKTYRYLPVFFKHFIPSRHEDPSTDPTLLNAAARLRFPHRFDAQTGIIQAEPGGQRLKPGLADPEERLDDPDVAFFLTHNPGHAQGDELACLARFDEENLRPFIRRHLDRSTISTAGLCWPL
jgi:hypothetical protein